MSPKIKKYNDTDYSVLIEEQLAIYFDYGYYKPNVTITCPGIVPRGNLTIDFIGADSEGEQFYVFSFLNTIVQKIMCSIRLSVTFVSHPSGFYNFETLLLDPIPLDPEGTKYGDIVATEQVNMIEVMTTFKNVDRGKYFSFFFLFEFHIWLGLAASICIMVILWNLTNSYQISPGRAFSYIIRSLTAQPIGNIRELLKNHIRNSGRRRKKTLFIMLFAIWLFIGATIQRCISSVLLNSYLKIQPEQLFNTLTEVYHAKNVKIAGSFVDLPNSSVIRKFDENRFLDLNKYPIRADLMDILKTIKLVKEGKSVICDQTHGMLQKVRIFQEFDDLVVMKMKYAPTYITFFINKNVTFKKEILTLILNGFEAGLYTRYRLVEDLKIDIRRMILKSILPNEYNGMLHSDQDNFALGLTEIWRSVILILVMGYYFTLIVLIVELVYHRHFEQKIEIILKTQNQSSFFYKLLNSRKKFVKKAKRLRSLNFHPGEVHRKLRSNYRLYFQK